MALQFKPGPIVVALVLLGCTLPCVGQGSQPTSVPGPEHLPEHRKMGYFAGDWKLQGTMKLSATVPGGDFTSTEHSEWVTGEFFLETHSHMTSVMGDVRGVRVMEYNPEDKVYTYNAYNSLGEHLMAIGHVVDNTWVWTSEAKLNGVIAKGRYTITVVSPTEYTFKYETLTPAGAWFTAMEGKATRSL